MNVKLGKRTLATQAIIVGVVALFLVSLYFLMGFDAHLHPEDTVAKGYDNTSTFFYKWYWLFAGVFLLLLVLYSVWGVIQGFKNKECIPVKIADKTKKYGFLLAQLVGRDFKSKYKRSFLGIFWSFLNPLMMMGVQYIIFSKLFGNASIINFPVYLLIGVVFFSFISESSNNGLVSITANSTLINKVYVPKYIYPISKLLSSAINFSISLVPLLIIVLITQIPGATWPTDPGTFIALILGGLVLFSMAVLLLFAFALGLSMLLSTVMVFFRDIQFLWGVLVTIWMYGTPIFYSIKTVDTAGNRFVEPHSLPWFVINCNPLYHFIDFTREIFIYGRCPNIVTIGICALAAVVMLVLGASVFRWKQDKFVLYI